MAERFPVDREACRLADALVGPRRFRIPHVEEIEDKRADATGEGELQGRIGLDRLRERFIEQIGDIDFAALQHGEPGGRLRDALEHQPLYRGHLAPIFLVRLHDQFDARLVADELVRAERRSDAS